MKNKRNCEAFSSIEFIVTLFFLVLIFIAFGILLRGADFSIKKRIKDSPNKEQIDVILTQIYDEIKKDNTPFADSKFDSVWKFDGTVIDGYKIQIKSLSGLINLNYLQKDFLNKTKLKALFDDENSINTLYERQHEKGLLYSYEEINDLIEEDVFNQYFTFKGFLNFNICNLDALKFVADSLTNSSFGDELFNQRKILKSNKQLIQNETEFNMLCGIYYNDIYPYINICPQININFMSEELINILFFYPDFNVLNPKQKVNTIIAMRDSKEITENELMNVLGITKGSELYYYIGCSTWLWQITIEGENTYCCVVLARAPKETALGETEFYIIEKKWL